MTPEDTKKRLDNIARSVKRPSQKDHIQNYAGSRQNPEAESGVDRLRQIISDHERVGLIGQIGRGWITVPQAREVLAILDGGEPVYRSASNNLTVDEPKEAK